MEKIITKPGQAPVAHFVSGLRQCEKKTVVWEVQNVVELLKMPRKKIRDSGITFDAGHSIGIPATWNFYFFRSSRCGRVGSIVNCLKLSPDSKAKVVKASCSISLSCGGETVARGDIVTREFKSPVTAGGHGGRITYLRAGRRVTASDILQKTDNGRRALKATLTLKVFSSKDPLTTPKAGVLDNAAVISDLGKLLESEDGTDSADVEISVPSVLGGDVDASSYKRKVHKCILMTRSPVFAAMFAKRTQMLETKKTGKVVIKDLSPKGLDIFLHHIYTGKVLREWVRVPEEILNAAEKYDCGRLKQYCGQNLMAAVTTRNAWELFQLAKRYNLSFAKRAIAEFVSKNARAVLEDGDDPSEEEEEEEANDTE